MKRIVSLVLCMVLVFGVTSVFGAEPDWKMLYETKMNQIISEYKDGNRDTHDFINMWGDDAYYFALLDINFDGIPELYHTLCSFFELEPGTQPEYEELYYIKNGEVKKAAVPLFRKLNILPMCAGKMENPGALYEYNSRWQFVLRNKTTGEVCFVTNDSYSGFMDAPERCYNRLIFNSEIGAVWVEGLVHQEIDSYAEEDALYLTGYEFVAQGAYNSYSQGEYNIENWKPGYIAPTVTIEGTPVQFDAPPVIVNDRTLVPIRRIAETLGAEVEWNEPEQMVTIAKDGIKVVMGIGKDRYTVNGEEKVLDVPAQLMSGRTMIPVRALSESFDCHVDWDEENQVVMITK